MLVRNGAIEVTAQRDGMVHGNNPGTAAVHHDGGQRSCSKHSLKYRWLGAWSTRRAGGAASGKTVER